MDYKEAEMILVNIEGSLTDIAEASDLERVLEYLRSRGAIEEDEKIGREYDRRELWKDVFMQETKREGFVLGASVAAADEALKAYDERFRK